MMHNLKGQSTVMELKASIIYDLRVRNQDWAFKMLALSQSQTQLTKGRYNGMDDGVEATMYLHLPYSSSQSVSRKYVLYMHTCCTNLWLIYSFTMRFFMHAMLDGKIWRMKNVDGKY